MSKSVGKKKKRKMNSYLKMGLWMLAGAIIGGLSSRVLLFSRHSMESVLKSVYEVIAYNVFSIIIVLAAVQIVLCLVSYFKAEKIIKLAEHCADEDEELLESKFDICSTIGVMASQVATFVGFILLGFIMETEGNLNRLGTVGVFLLIGVVGGVYQIIAVKQLQRKDPSKKGDPSDLRFNKDWLKSCDEAERTIIYQASYKTFNFMKMAMMSTMLLALLAQLLFNVGVAPLVFTGIVYIMMLIVYAVYSASLRELKLND